jgi:protein-tyrosine phosphatase
VSLPEPRTPGRYRVALVCLGNICRSPMAHVVLEDEVDRAGLADRVEVVSAGTGGWHVGNPIDPRAAAVLTAHGYDASRHRARRLDRSWIEDCDLVLTMDSTNHADVLEHAHDPDEWDRVRMFRDLDPRASEGDRDVPDPYYGRDDGFEHVLAMVTRSARVLVEQLRDALASAP